jgi:hypothetical protein
MLGSRGNGTAVLAVVLLLAIGSVAFYLKHRPTATANGGVPGTGADIDSLADIGAGCPLGKKAKLTLAGDPLDVELACKDVSGEIGIKLSAHSATFEEERYRMTPTSFQLLDAAGESYEPPIELIKVPMQVGAKWDWSGKMMAGQIAHNARATITTSTNKVFASGAPLDALKVDVDFLIDGGGSSPAKRSLSFWIAPKLGVFKRKFGDSSLRDPAGP